MTTKGVNKVILIGNLGHDPEVRYMPNGNAVTNFTLATSDIWRNKQNGELQEKTEWHRIVIFGKLAEVAGEYLRKGSQVYIEGSLQTRKWQDQNGQDHYSTEVIVNIGGSMQMLGNRNISQEIIPQNNSTSKWKRSSQLQQDKRFGVDEPKSIISNNPSNTSSEVPIELPIDFDDDIPF